MFNRYKYLGYMVILLVCIYEKPLQLPYTVGSTSILPYFIHQKTQYYVPHLWRKNNSNAINWINTTRIFLCLHIQKYYINQQLYPKLLVQHKYENPLNYENTPQLIIFGIQMRNFGAKMRYILLIASYLQWYLQESCLHL